MLDFDGAMADLAAHGRVGLGSRALGRSGVALLADRFRSDDYRAVLRESRRADCRGPGLAGGGNGVIGEPGRGACGEVREAQ